MFGLMQQEPLLVSSLIKHADRHHGAVEIVSRCVEGDIHRYTYHELHQRSRKLANAVHSLGIQDADRVATLAWNGYRHMELYYAISGMGAIMHTVNPRLHADQITYIVNHAEDQCLFFDLTFLPIVESIAGQLTSVKHFVAMTDRAHLPQNSTIPNLLCYEDLLDAQQADFAWPIFDENKACSLCYTSGTTGNPKGALYSHRSTLLHTYAAALPDSMNCSARDVVLPVVPMFHVNAWGLPYIACMVGAKLVFPGPALDGKSLYDLFEAERVTLAAGVPTIWQGLLNHVESHGLHFTSLKRTVIGGSACPPVMLKKFQEQYAVNVIHAWGMTELSPLGSVFAPRVGYAELSSEQRYALQAKQGRAIYGIDFKIVDDQGHELPWDGIAAGDLLVRGPWVIADYYRSEGTTPLIADAAGQVWFPTGDVAKIDAQGYMQITDRSKDVIKSGGEWIGSIDLENVAMAHPAVAMAACIAVAHPKWDERPLLVVVKKLGAELTREELLQFYEGKIAKWWTPDDVVFVETLPLGATGKLLKNKLREQFRQYVLPTAK